MRSDLVTTTFPETSSKLGLAKPMRPKTTHGNGTDRGGFTIASNWPDSVPATAGEVAVIETFLSDVLDDLLSRCAPGSVERHS